jgi:hypothetical protein
VQTVQLLLLAPAEAEVVELLQPVLQELQEETEEHLVEEPAEGESLQQQPLEEPVVSEVAENFVCTHFAELELTWLKSMEQWIKLWSQVMLLHLITI